MPPFGSMPASRNAGLRTKIVTAVPSLKILRRRSLPALPQRDVLVVEDHRAAARRDLGKSIRQHRSNETDVRWVGGIDVLVQNLRNLGQKHSHR
jgi:hypothetical protein